MPPACAGESVLYGSDRDSGEFALSARYKGFLSLRVNDVVALTVKAGVTAEDEAAGVTALQFHEDTGVFALEAVQVAPPDAICRRGGAVVLLLKII